MNQKFSQIQDAYIAVFPPPAVQGLGQIGGFKLQIEDRAGLGFRDALSPRRRSSSRAGRARPELANVFSGFEINAPQVKANIDRDKAQSQGVALTDLFETMQVYLGSLYVNDFNRFGRTYQVNAQADMPFRLEPDDILRLKVRNSAGEMVPLGSFVTLEQSAGPSVVQRYNGYPSAEITGGPAPGYSSGQAQAAIEELAARGLPNGLELRLDRARVSAIDRRQHGRVDVSAVRAARVSRARRAVRELVVAARRDPDRADVPTVRDRRCVAHRRRQQHLHADRTHRARGARVQERDPDRRVRAHARARRARARGTRCSRRASCASARS